MDITVKSEVNDNVKAIHLQNAEINSAMKGNRFNS